MTSPRRPAAAVTDAAVSLLMCPAGVAVEWFDATRSGQFTGALSSLRGPGEDKSDQISTCPADTQCGKC